MRQLIGNQTILIIQGLEVLTLRDLLPDPPSMQILFVGKCPTPTSVEAGHYFQGRQGRTFWNRLQKYGLLNSTEGFEDDALLRHSYGMTDITKVPRAFGHEPSEQEYTEGSLRILELIRVHGPSIIVFIHKKVLDSVLLYGFQTVTDTQYGFNPALDRLFGAPVFAFPLPGTPCRQTKAVTAMEELARLNEYQSHQR